MLRLSRLVVGALMLNVSFAGQALPCAHETAEAEQVASGDHTGTASHDAHAPADEAPPPCDHAQVTCCEAVTSCAMSGIPAGGSCASARDGLRATEFAGASSRPHSLLLEVATPPPRA